MGVITVNSKNTPVFNSDGNLSFFLTFWIFPSWKKSIFVLIIVYSCLTLILDCSTPHHIWDEDISLNLALLVEILNQADGKFKGFSLTRCSQTVCGRCIRQVTDIHIDFRLFIIDELHHVSPCDLIVFRWNLFQVWNPVLLFLYIFASYVLDFYSSSFIFFIKNSSFLGMKAEFQV